MQTVDCHLHVVDHAGRPVRDATAAIVRASRAMPEIGFRASDQGDIVISLPPGPAVIAVFGPNDIRQELYIDVPPAGTVSRTVVLSNE
jgi:hypothetical protein